MNEVEKVFWFNLLKSINDNFELLQTKINALEARVTELENA